MPFVVIKRLKHAHHSSRIFSDLADIPPPLIIEAVDLELKQGRSNQQISQIKNKIYEVYKIL